MMTWRKRLLEILPPEMVERAYIAGGYAANASRAEDIDVWILNTHYTDEDIRTIGRRFQSAGFKFASVEVNGEYPDDFIVVRTIKVGELDNILPIQVILSREGTIEQLLKSFDISSHLWAEKLNDDAGKRDSLVSSTQTFSGGLARVTNFTTPKATLGRLLKLSKRYNQLLDPHDVEKLLIAAGIEIEQDYRKAA